MNQVLNPSRFSGFLNKGFLIFVIIFFLFNKPVRTKENTLTSFDGLNSLVADTITSQVFFTADEMPKFEGREARYFSNWLEKNLIYPVEAIADSIQGRVYVQFIIDSIGQTRDIKIAKGVHKAIDDEALRLVAEATGWTAGKINGKPVNIQLTYPVIFQISVLKSPNIPDPSIRNGHEEQVYLSAEVMPEFLGNESKRFIEYIAMNIRFPIEAAEMRIQGTVYVQFIVNTEGDVTNVQIARSADPILDAEALRVVGTSPKWEPGKINGENVSVKLTYPVSFRVSFGPPPKPTRTRPNRNN